MKIAPARYIAAAAAPAARLFRRIVLVLSLPIQTNRSLTVTAPNEAHNIGKRFSSLLWREPSPLGRECSALDGCAEVLHALRRGAWSRHGHQPFVHFIP